MKRIVGGPIFARHVAQLAPRGYTFASPGYGYMPGRIFAGPYSDTQTTVCLLLDDDGQWFKDQLGTSGKWRYEGT